MFFYVFKMEIKTLEKGPNNTLREFLGQSTLNTDDPDRIAELDERIKEYEEKIEEMDRKIQELTEENEKLVNEQQVIIFFFFI